jgi:hypothetical protein
MPKHTSRGATLKEVSRAAVCATALPTPAGQPETVIRINVNLVQVDAAVIDSKGNHVAGLKERGRVGSASPFVEVADVAKMASRSLSIPVSP